MTQTLANEHTESGGVYLHGRGPFSNEWFSRLMAHWRSRGLRSPALSSPARERSSGNALRADAAPLSRASGGQARPRTPLLRSPNNSKNSREGGANTTAASGLPCSPSNPLLSSEAAGSTAVSGGRYASTAPLTSGSAGTELEGLGECASLLPAAASWRLSSVCLSSVCDA